MTGPQSLSPQQVVPSRPRKRFTLAEANKSLPLVRRIVADIVHAHQSVTQSQLVCDTAIGKKRQQAQADLERSVESLHAYAEELDSLGIELKDPKSGLVDFVSRHQGRDVYLCWRLGEEQVTHWHELQAGFVGRQPVSELRPDE